MERVIADTDLLQKLDGGNKSVDVCDASGRVLGYYFPHDDYQRLIYDWAFAVPSEESRQSAREELFQIGPMTIRRQRCSHPFDDHVSASKRSTEMRPSPFYCLPPSNALPFFPRLTSPTTPFR